MIPEILLKKLIEEFYHSLRNKLKFINNITISTQSDLQSCIKNHLIYVDNWSKEIPINFDGNSNSIAALYQDLKISLTAKKFLEDNESPKTVNSIFEVINDHHLVLLGDPGAGKTTTLQYIAHKLLHDNPSELEQFNFPILIELKNLKENDTIFDYLKNKLGFIINLVENSNSNKDTTNEIVKNSIYDFLNNFQVILLIDGLDEIEYKYNNIISDFRDLSLNLSSSLAILTCRSGAFNSLIKNCQVYEICPLDETSIVQFANKQFIQSQESELFLSGLRKSPYYDTAMRPLLLILLCVLFKKNKSIPEKPKSVYKRIIQLLIDEWDQKRSIFRPTEYAKFEPDRKLEFLSRFAFELTFQYQHGQYNSKMFKEIYLTIYQDFGLIENEAEKVILEIESHNGIISKMGYDKYGFSHKSIQEYLAANYIIHLPEIPLNIPLSSFSSEFAIATSLSSDPNAYFTNIVINFLSNPIFRISERDMESFLTRILIEKPDFSKSPTWLIIIFYVYSIFRMKKNVFSNLTDKLLISNDIKDVYQNVLKYYTEIEIDSDNISLEFKSNMSDFMQNGLKYPEYIILNRAFIENFRS